MLDYWGVWRRVLSGATLFWESQECVNFSRTRQSTWTVGLAAVDADRSWTRDVVDGIENALCRAAAVAERARSLLTSKKRFKERASLGRLLLYMSYRRWWRCVGWWFVVLQPGRKIA